MVATILSQVLLQGTPALGPLPWMIGLGVLIYLLYKTCKDVFDKTPSADATEFRKMVLGLPSLVVVMSIVAISTLSVSLAAIFGPAVFIVDYLLEIFIPMGIGLICVLPIAFTVALSKKELSRPGI